jgi:maleate cis-trans isomerase
MQDLTPNRVVANEHLAQGVRMTIHFGVLIPSTNTTTETEYSRLPPGYQAHYARVRTSTPGRPFSPGREEEVTYQSELLATAKVQMVALLQTSASLFADDYDETTMKRMQAAAGVPSITSALAVGRAVRALGARRIALVSPYSPEVNERARHYFTAGHGLDIAALDGFAATDSYAIGKLGPENARAAFARIDRSGIEAFVVPGGNFATMASIAAWEAEFGKPVVTSSQALLWAVARQLGGEPLAECGRLLDQLPPG